jgi:hypothetical protein
MAAAVMRRKCVVETPELDFFWTLTDILAAHLRRCRLIAEMVRVGERQRQEQLLAQVKTRKEHRTQVVLGVRKKS